MKVHYREVVWKASGILIGCTLCASRIVWAQTDSVATSTVALTVEKGSPLRVIVIKRLRMKQDEPIQARVVEPVYAFDREVVPPGAEVTGRIRQLQGVPRRVRVAAILAGDLTPLHDPQIEFDTLILKNGKRVPLKTSVFPGSDTAVRFDSSKKGRKKGTLTTAADMARQQIEARKRAVIDAVRTPGKLQRLADMFLARLPYHPQSVPAGTRLNARLLAPLDFGKAPLPVSEFGQIGSQPPADSIVRARLTSALDSRTAHKGLPVEAVLSQPLFSADHHLLFPEGSRMHGTIVQARAARRWHRNGRLRFTFHGIEPPASTQNMEALRRIEGRLESVEVENKGKEAVKVDEEGGTKVAASKKRFLAPALTLMLASRGMDDDPIRIHGVPTGARQANYGGKAVSGAVGFGLIGSAVAQVSQPFATTLGFYGAGWSIYRNLIARGNEVQFPVDTPIEIRFGPRAGSQK